MKKSILLLSGAGIAAGVAIALTATKKKTDRLPKAKEEERERMSDHEQMTNQAEDSNESPSLSAKATSNPDPSTATSMKKAGAASGELEVDDHGTDQETASAILERVRDDAFDSSDEKLALALGRPTEEVTRWMDGSEIIDGDVLLKVRALAIQRGVEVPDAASN